VSLDEQHIALPKLMGAPAYARPPRPVEPVERPIDLDDLPIEAARTPDDLELAVVLPPPAGVHYGASEPPPSASAMSVASMPGAAAAATPGGNGQGAASLDGRPFSIKGLARYLSGK
jgi:hypothetical protein